MAECPTCGDSLSTERGMKIHHANVHGESISDIDKECDLCGTDITIDRTKKSSKYHFCDECSKDKIPDGKPESWDSDTVKYGKKWKKMKTRVQKRDENTCQKCGKSEKQLNRKPAVHHIMPVRCFDDPDESHEMKNLVQVCTSCHMEVEGLPVGMQKKQLSGFSAERAV